MGDMESQKEGTKIYPIPEEEDGACGGGETNEDVPQSQNVQWGISPMGPDTWTEIHVDDLRTGDKRGSTLRGRMGRGCRMFVASRPCRYRQYSNERNLFLQGDRKSDQVKNEHGKTSGGVGCKTQQNNEFDWGTSGDGTAKASKIWTRSIIVPTVAAPENRNKSQHVVQSNQSYIKSWSAPGAYSAYFNTVSQQMQESVPTPYNQQESSGSGNNTNNKKQFNKAPGSLPHARENKDVKPGSYMHYGQEMTTPASFGETRHYTRRNGRGAYHNTARPSTQHPVEQRGRNYFRGSASCSRSTGDFSRRGHTCLRGIRRPFPRRGAQTRRQAFYTRPFYVNRTPKVGDAYANPRVPSASTQPEASSEQKTTFPSGESFRNMYDGLENFSFTITNDHFVPNPSFVNTEPEPPSEVLVHSMATSDSEYVSVRVVSHQSAPEEQQAALRPFLYPRPVMQLMVPQNPPVATPVYYQQPVMGAAWSPYVPLMETYNETPCYPPDYSNSGYYTPSYGNPVYQNNPMEFMPPNPAGDPTGHVQNNVVGEGAVPPQSEVQQSGEAQIRPPVCSQCAGCGTCGNCTCPHRPRTYFPLPNHGTDLQPFTSSTVAEDRPGPINFGVEKSVKDDGSDLPKDIATLRFFFNLGVDAHRSASQGVPNGDARPVPVQEESSSAEQEIGDEISSLVGRLHRVVFRQSPEPQVLQNINCSEHPKKGSEMWKSKKDSAHLPAKGVGVHLTEDDDLPTTDSGVDMTFEINYGHQCTQVLHTARTPPTIKEIPTSDDSDTQPQREERKELHSEFFPPLPTPGTVSARRGGRGLHDNDEVQPKPTTTSQTVISKPSGGSYRWNQLQAVQARFPLNQRNPHQVRLPPMYYVTPGKFPWSQNKKEGNMGRGIDNVRGNGRLRTRRNSEDCSGEMSARPAVSSSDASEQYSNWRK